MKREGLEDIVATKIEKQFLQLLMERSLTITQNALEYALQSGKPGPKGAL